MTKATFLAAALVGALAVPAVAGGLADPIMELEIVVQDIDQPASSSAQRLPSIIFSLLTLAARLG